MHRFLCGLCCSAIALLFPASVLSVISPADVPHPRLGGPTVDYIEWYRGLTRTKKGDNALLVYQPLLRPPNNACSRPQTVDSAGDSAKVLAEIEELLTAPRVWRSRDCPLLNAAIERERPKLAAYLSGAGKPFVVPVPSPDCDGLAYLYLPYLSYVRTTSRLMLVNALRKEKASVGLAQCIQNVLLHACQLSPLEVTAPVIQYSVSFRLREDTYRFAVLCLRRSLLNGHDLSSLAGSLLHLDNIDLRTRLSSSMAFEEARDYELIQNWFDVQDQRFSHSKMRKWARHVYPTPKGALISEAKPQRVAKKIAWYWRALYQTFANPENRDLFMNVRDIDRSLASQSAFAAEYLGWSMLPPLRYATDAEVWRRGTRVILGLFTWRSTHGTWPKDLDVIHIDRLSVSDPYAPGHRFVYRTQGTTAMLYSVGTDGKDNGGVDGDDIVLWPPAERQ